jgi:hypothetical protein
MFSFFLPPKPEGFGGAEMGITVKDLNALDEIAIRTRHSEYRFRITDPHQGRGLLTGGLFGEDEHDAIVTGSPAPADLHSHFSTQLEIGSSAFFYVSVEDSVRLLTTTTITDLTLAARRDPIFLSVCCY